MFFNELLEPVNLSLECTDTTDIQNRLSLISFNSFVTFINSLEVVFKQVGTLLIRNLPILAKIIVQGIIRLSKMFMKSVKSSVAADAEMAGPEDSESEQGDDELHRNASKQAKDCLRKSMGLIKDIYKRFSQHESFIREFSEAVFQEIVQDQLKDLKVNFTSEKSQLIEILCQSWPEHLNTLSNFQKYPDVIPALMDMLQHRAISPEVVNLIMGLLKKFIIGTMDSSEDGTKGKEAAARRRMLDEEDLKEIEDVSID